MYFKKEKRKMFDCNRCICATCRHSKKCCRSCKGIVRLCDGWEVIEMITGYQKSYIEKLYERLGQEVEDDVEELTKREATKRIKELKELLEGY